MAALVLDGKAFDVGRLFGGEEGLWLSLRHRWVTMLARFTSRYAVWIVVVWVVGAGAANLAVPQLERVEESHARSSCPQTRSVPSQRGTPLGCSVSRPATTSIMLCWNAINP